MGEYWSSSLFTCFDNPSHHGNDLCLGTAALLKFDQTHKYIKHTTGKNKPSLVSALIFRVTDQSTVKCHHFENCNFYKVLYGEQASLARSAHLPQKPYNNRNFQIDSAWRYFGV